MGRSVSAAALRPTLGTHLLALPLLPAVALPVSAGSPVRVDFNLQPLENEQFSFPAVLMDYTVFFDHADPLSFGENYRVETYTSSGLLIRTDSYTNETFGGIIGCACITQHLL